MKLKFLSILLLLGCSLTWAYSLQYHPLLLKVSDKKGKTLIKALDEVYGDKITVKNGRCYFFEKQARGADLEYEIDRCRMDYQQQTIYSQADRLNGIEIKGTVWIEGNSYRTRPYNGKWGEWKVRVAATDNELPFEQYILDALLAQVRKGIETLIWQGDTGGSPASPIDGFLTQFGADSNVVTVTLTGVTGAYDAVKAVYFGMSAEALDRGGIIFVDPIVLRALVNDLVVLNMFHYNPGNGNLDEFILPGTDVRIVKAPGLAGTNAIVGTFGDNLVYGTDMEGDNEKVFLRYSEDDEVFKYTIKWNSGVAYHFSEHIAWGVMDDAPTPLGTCPCVAADDGGGE